MKSRIEQAVIVMEANTINILKMTFHSYVFGPTTISISLYVYIQSQMTHALAQDQTESRVTYLHMFVSNGTCSNSVILR